MIKQLIRKLYFQTGSGRKEAALLRGLGYAASKKLLKKVLQIMKVEGLYKTAPGMEGIIYIPIRKHTKRLKQIMDEMSLSKDELWLKVTKLC